MSTSGGRLTTYPHDGLTFDVTDTGPEDGDPVVLLHGFPERATAWREVSPLLHEHGLRTYAPDQRGYSPDARPRRRWSYTTPRLVGDVEALIDRIGRPVHLVGHDWGALVGWQLAARRPDLVRTWTAVSVPHPAAFLRALVSSGQARRSWYMAAFQLPGLTELLADRTDRLDRMMRGAGMTRDEVARFRTEIVDDGALRGGLMWYRALPLADPRRTGGRVRVPTTMVWSDHDVALDRAGIDLTEQYVAAPYELVVLEGATHWIPTQEPRALADAVLARIGSLDEG